MDVPSDSEDEKAAPEPKAKVNGGTHVSKAKPANGAVQPKNQLEYLAKVLGVDVTYKDFPQKGGNKKEFFSLVTISTNPPQVKAQVSCMVGI